MRPFVATAAAWCAGALILAGWWTLIIQSRAGVDFGLGSLSLPTRITSSMYGMFLAFAVVVAPLWVAAFRRLGPALEARLGADWARFGERQRLALAAFAALAAGLLVRGWVLRGASLTDDEDAYRFVADLLARGRLWVESPEPRQFFDNAFLINDGRLYGAHAIGWPLVLMPFRLAHLEGLVNPLLVAATVPAVSGLADHIGGRRAAGWASVLFVVSPMIATGSATLLPHPGALAISCWLLWVVQCRATHRERRWDALAVSLFGGLLFFRPTAAVGLGLPALFWWGTSRLGARAPDRSRRLVVFLGGLGLVAALFMAVNAAQTGSAWKPAFVRALEYAAETEYRFAAWSGPTSLLESGSFRLWLTLVVSTLLRLNADLFGLPLSLLPLAFVAWSRDHRLLVTSALGLVVVTTLGPDAGVDTFAPLQVYEAAGAVVVLAALGLARLESEASAAPIRSIIVSVFAVAWATVVPMRWFSIHRLAQDVLLPQETVEAASLSNAVVFFVGPPFQCSQFARHYKLHRPNNSPGLEDEVLWVNHLTLERDLDLMRTRFPGRQGYLLFERYDCTGGLMLVDDPRAAEFAPPSKELEERSRAR